MSDEIYFGGDSIASNSPSSGMLTISGAGITTGILRISIIKPPITIFP